jgi:hypothetical protein
MSDECHKQRRSQLKRGLTRNTFLREKDTEANLCRVQIIVFYRQCTYIVIMLH